MRRCLAVLVAILVSLPLTAPGATAAPPRLRARAVQSGLTNPWDVAFAPGGRMVVSTRPGFLHVFASGQPGARRLSRLKIPRVRAEGEAGAMGVAVRKGPRGVFVYVCASRTTVEKRLWRNQVLRYRLTKTGNLRYDRFVLGGMRANTIHNGCAVEVGPGGRIWIAMGDANDLSLPQDWNSRNGKILRVRWNGSAPKANPRRGSRIYSRGHRNPQGIAFQPGTGRVYAAEHGPQVNDEINRIVTGGNYGWPYCAGTSRANGFNRDCSRYRRPAWQSGSRTIATSGAAFVAGEPWGSWRRSLFVSTLKQSDLRRFTIGNEGRTATRRNVAYDDRFGRLRAATLGPGSRRPLYVTTSNNRNDKVVRIRP
ncbi:MAG: PQQ-dependent sugar dehydrogenase [Egibacteraceae bacterium]